MSPPHLLLALFPTSAMSFDIVYLPEDTDLMPELWSFSCSPRNLSFPGVERPCISLFTSMNQQGLSLSVGTGWGEKGKWSLHWLT